MAGLLPTAQQFLRHLGRDLTGKETECCICAEDFGTRPSDKARPEHAVTLPGCGHVFGSECITEWLTPHNGEHNVTCPMCRKVLCQYEGIPKNNNDLQLGVFEGIPQNRNDPRLDIFEGAPQNRNDPRLRILQSREAVDTRNRSTQSVRHMMSIAAVMGVPRNTEPGPRNSMDVIHSRQWLRRRLEANPPRGQVAVRDWFNHDRPSAAHYRANIPPIDHRRLRWVHYREMMLYIDLQHSGADLPPLPSTEIGPDGLQMDEANDTAFLEELESRGAFLARPNSHYESWIRGLSPRQIWKVYREEGYVYGALLDPDRRRDGYHGWVGMLYDTTFYPSLLETETWLLD